MDINFLLGSWGSQPDEHREVAPVVAVERCLSRGDWYELAVRFAGFALQAIEEGREADAAGYAAGAVRFCREHQFAGGHPTDGN